MIYTYLRALHFIWHTECYTFSSVSRLLFDGFSWQFRYGTPRNFTTNPVSLVALCQK